MADRGEDADIAREDKGPERNRKYGGVEGKEGQMLKSKGKG